MIVQEITAEIKAHFLRLYEFAMTDNDFSSEEWKMLYDFGIERGISKEQLDKILLTTTGELPVPSKLEKKIEYLFDFCCMIWADGKVTEEEKRTLSKYISKFGFKEENIIPLSEYLLKSVKNGIKKEAILIELNS
jgi:hypothetical protein